MSDCTNDFENNIPDTEKTVPAENHQEQQEYQLQHQENEAAYLEPGTSNSAVPTSPAAPANPAPAHAAGPTPPAAVEPTPASSDAVPEAAASEGAINSPDSKTKSQQHTDPATRSLYLAALWELPLALYWWCCRSSSLVFSTYHYCQTLALLAKRSPSTRGIPRQTWHRPSQRSACPRSRRLT